MPANTKFKVMLQGIEETFEVIALGIDRVAAMVSREPERFRTKQARPQGVVGIENTRTGKARFYKLSDGNLVLYPITPATAATLFAIAA